MSSFLKAMRLSVTTYNPVSGDKLFNDLLTNWPLSTNEPSMPTQSQHSNNGLLDCKTIFGLKWLKLLVRIVTCFSTFPISVLTDELFITFNPKFFMLMQQSSRRYMLNLFKFIWD